MVFPAIAIVQCTSVLWRGRLWPLQWLRAASVAALVALCAVASLRTYFSYYTGSLQFGTDHSEAAWIARDYADRYTVHLVSWSFRYGPWDSQELILAGVPVDRNDKDSDAAYIQTVQLTGSDLFIVSDWRRPRAMRWSPGSRRRASKPSAAIRRPGRGPTSCSWASRGRQRLGDLCTG
jgi:hypothetical protein